MTVDIVHYVAYRIYYIMSCMFYPDSDVRLSSVVIITYLKMCSLLNLPFGKDFVQ